MKQVFVFLLSVCGFGPTALSAQFNALPDDKRQYLLSFRHDTMRVDTLNEWSYLSKNAEDTRFYAQTALDYAGKIGYRKGIGDAWQQLGTAALRAKDYDAAKAHYQTALQKRLNAKLYAQAAGSCNQLGTVCRRLNQFDAAADWYRKSLSIMKGRPPHINTAYAYNGLGDVCRLAARYEKADSAFKAGLDEYKRLANSDFASKAPAEYAAGLASLRMNYGAYLQDRQKYPQAQEILTACLTDYRALKKTVQEGKCLLLLGNNAYLTNRFEDAHSYYEQAIAMKGAIDEKDYFVLLKNRGRVRLDQGESKAAIRDFKAALGGFSTLQQENLLAETQFEMGNYFYEQAQIDSAVQYYQSSLSSASADPLLKSRVLYFLSDALHEKGDTASADRYTDEYILHLDSLSHSNIPLAFNDLNRYQLNKNRLLKQSAIKAKNQMKTYSIAGVSAISMLAFAFIAFYRQRRRAAEQRAQKDSEIALQQTEIALQQTEIARQQTEIAHQTAEQAQKDLELARQREQIVVAEKLELIRNKELETTYARLAGQDEMQKKIGQELHDSVGAMLAGIKLTLAPVDEVLDALPNEKRQLFVKANNLLNETTQEVRRISHELSSAVLRKFGLKAQLEALADILSGGAGQLQVELATHGLKDRLDNHTEFNIYRMIQELVHNVVKHAQANHISIQVNRFGEHINIIVEDDGIGFDPESIRNNPGIGMSNLAARVHDLNGQMQIDSRIGRGTTVSIDIPLKREHEIPGFGGI